MSDQSANAGFLCRMGRGLFFALGIVAFVLGVLSTGWMVLMMRQWAVPWSSLSITAPPGQKMKLEKPPVVPPRR